MEQGQSKQEGQKKHAGATIPAPTKEHFDDVLKSVKQIPKQEELRGFSLEKLYAGRLDRLNYIYGLIVGIIICAVLYRIAIIGAIAGLVLGVIGIAATARRFRDINISGWLALLGLIPFVNLIVAIYLCFAEQVTVGNRFGAVPNPKRPFFYAILNL